MSAPLWPLFASNPLAAYGAVVSTLSFVLAGFLAVQAYRKHRRDLGLLKIERAGPGSVTGLGFSYQTINIVLLNLGSTTVSVTRYDAVGFDGWFSRLLGRNPINFKGSGWKLDSDTNFESHSLRTKDDPPIPVKVGESIRLRIDAKRFWPAHKSERAIFVRIWYSHARRPLKRFVAPNEYCVLSDKELAEKDSKFGLYLTRDLELT